MGIEFVWLASLVSWSHAIMWNSKKCNISSRQMVRQAGRQAGRQIEPRRKDRERDRWNEVRTYYIQAGIYINIPKYKVSYVFVKFIKTLRAPAPKIIMAPKVILTNFVIIVGKLSVLELVKMGATTWLGELLDSLYSWRRQRIVSCRA